MMTRTPKDGHGPECRTGKPFDTYLTIGSIRMRIDRDAYTGWEARLRSDCEFNAKRIEAELRRRLGL